MEAKCNQKWLLVIVVMELSLIVGTSSCKNKILLRSGPVSGNDKWIILNAHNLFRQLLALGKVPGQPQAANLQEIKWDTRLAARAQFWSDSCYSEEHDSNRHDYGCPVGQNIATYWTTHTPRSADAVLPNFVKAIKDWFQENESYRFGNIFQDDSGTGHYTQVVWHETNRVGCGYSFYYDPSKGFTKNYICNYAPSGNVLLKKPYVIGPPACFRFGMQSSQLYSGLCEKSPHTDQLIIFPNFGNAIKSNVQLYNNTISK